MARKNSGESEPSRRDILNSVARDDTNRPDSGGKNRRSVLKGFAMSLMGVVGLSSMVKPATASPVKVKEVGEDEARKAIGQYRAQLAHLKQHDVIDEVNIGNLVAKVKSNSSAENGLEAEFIQGTEDDKIPALTVTLEGSEETISMAFPLNGDYALFDLPDSVDSESINQSWNKQNSDDQMSTQDNLDDGSGGTSSCPEGNDSCCCNVSSCDYCHCTYWGYCDCTTVAGTECWYKYCDCCSDAVNYCTRYCGAPLQYNC